MLGEFAEFLELDKGVSRIRWKRADAPEFRWRKGDVTVKGLIYDGSYRSQQAIEHLCQNRDMFRLAWGYVYFATDLTGLYRNWQGMPAEKFLEEYMPLESPDRCKAQKTIEDEICVMGFQCELETGHEGQHQTTYPGLEDFDPPTMIRFDEGEERQQIRKADYRQIDGRVST